MPELTNPLDRGQNQTKLASLLAEENQSYRSGTPILLEREKAQDSSAFKPLVEAESRFQRPTDPGGGIDGLQHLLPQLYNTTHFILHWTNGSDGGSLADAVSLEDNDTTGFPDYIENFAVIFENVWNFEINQRGFNAPPSDIAEPNDENNRNPDARYDVFIYDMDYYGYANIEQWPNLTSYSHIGVENDFVGPFHKPQIEAMQITAAHEFFHAIQFGYDTHEERWWMEATAVYMEDEVYPDVNQNYIYLPGWFDCCDIYGLENTTGLHEYGTFIWAKRLSEDFGDEIIKEIWEEMNYTDGLEAINNVLLSKNSSLVEEFSHFTTANFFLEDMYADGVEYRNAVVNKTYFGGVYLAYQYDAHSASNYTEINASNVNYYAWMDKWATDYITLKLDPTKPRYNITFDGLDTTTNYLVKLVTKKGSNITEEIFQLNAEKDGNLTLSYDMFDNITLIIANAGNTATTNPSWRVIITVLPGKPLPLATIFVDPANITDPNLAPGQKFTVEVKIQNVTNLYHIALQLSWGATLLNYTSHTVKIPVEDYPDGILHTPTSMVKDNVNQTSGRYELNYSSIAPAIPFNGSGTILNMTFEVIGRGECYLNIFSVSLLDIDNQLIFYKTTNGYFYNNFRDVAIIRIESSASFASPNSTVTILVTVKNNGTFEQESFTVSVYWGETLIGCRVVNDLAPGMEETLKITWTVPANLEGSEKIWASATLIPEDINPDNNILEDGALTISIPQDLSGGGSIRPPLLK